MLLGLALIGLRENLYEKGSQEGDGDTDGHVKHTLSIHYYISIQTRECYTFDEQVIPLYNWFEIDW